MKKHRQIKHVNRKAMTSQKLAKGKFSKCHLPKKKTIIDSCGNDGFCFFFIHICSHCWARGKFDCHNCVVWK